MNSRSAGLTAPVDGNATAAIKRVRQVLAKVNTSGSSNPTGTVIAHVRVPSSRLSVAMSVAFEPDAGAAVSSYSNAQWTVRAMRPGDSRSGSKECELHEVDSSKALPRMYEATSNVRLFKITCALAVPVDGSAAAIAGSWVLECEYEPNTLICDADAEMLLPVCTANVVKALSAPLAP